MTTLELTEAHSESVAASPDTSRALEYVFEDDGRPLPPAIRSAMERRFAHDFSHVRVHTSEGAARSAEAVRAEAFTVGGDVVFGRGRFEPGTSRGTALLAHELAHVVQQGRGTRAPAGADVDTLPVLGVRDDPVAERAADAASAGRPGGTIELQPVPLSLQRSPDPPPGPQAAPSAAGGTTAPADDCFIPVAGEEIEALLQSRTVTVVEFWESWCGPCKDLQADLRQLCRRYRATPPAASVRFFSVDAGDPANAKISARFGADASVPQLLVFVGPTLERHYGDRPEFENLERILTEAIDLAARSGLARGAATGAKVGAFVGGGLGLAAGVALALTGVLTGGLGLLAVLGLAVGGALVGAGLGAAIGAFVGWLSDKRDIRGNARRGAFEADALIQRRFGADIPRGTPPLRGAPVHAVTQAELRMLQECRTGKKAPADIVGWTDAGSEHQPIASAADEPVCANGKQLEHATPQRPVIYYAKDQPDATVLIHEGLHAYNHPHFSSQLRDNMTEAATEYFTRQIGAEIGASSSSAYGNWLEYIEQLVRTIGEPALRAAYFRGDFGPANAVLGRCGLEVWAQHHLKYEQESAAEILRVRGGDYCSRYLRYPEPGVEPAPEPTGAKP